MNELTYIKRRERLFYLTNVNLQRNSGYWGTEHLKKIKIGSFLVFNCLKTFLFEKKTISLQRYIYILVTERNKQKLRINII